MKTILFATDLSSRSDRAFERAAALTDQHKAHLVVLHIVDEEQRPAAIHHLVEVARGAIEDDLTSQNLRRTQGADVEVKIVPGNGFADIIRQADEVEAELIVLGTHRADPLAELFQGTTAERVIRESHAPVLLVKEQCRRPYARVLAAIDFSVYSRRAMQTALKLAPTAAFHLLHVFHVPFSAFLVGQDTRERLRRQQKERLYTMIEEELNALTGTTPEVSPTVEKIIREGEIESAIRGEVQRLEPDLLVVGTHGRTGASHALLGSIAEDMLRDPPCDVLAVKAW